MTFDPKGERRVEGPLWGDAQLYGNWLLGAAQANELLQELKRVDPEFRHLLDSIEDLDKVVSNGARGDFFVALSVRKQTW
jgi:hypothetical protein